MPQALNIDGVSENSFELLMLVHSSRSFCAKHSIRWENDDVVEFDWNYYFGWLKSLICEKLIRTAITLRMVQDILIADEMQDPAVLRRYQVDSVSGIELGMVRKGVFDLTLRETCNKIIHATDTQLDWHQEDGYEWWTGKVQLFGSNRSEAWELELNTEAFAIAAKRYVDFVSDGVDWYHVYKHDR